MNLESELDYPREARTQHEIAERYRGHPFIVVPDCVPELCTSQILVTEFLDGQAFPYMQTLPEDERNRIGELIFRFYIGSLFQDNDFCGDPHPGNILLAADGTVGFVDFGLYNRMNPEHVDFERHIMRSPPRAAPRTCTTRWSRAESSIPRPASAPKTAWSTAMRHLGGTSSTRT